MSSFYEASTSGMNWDRFTSADVNDALMNDSTALKVKQAFWSAKQLLREKLGKREDEHVVLADAELDAHLQAFRQIRNSTQTLLSLMETHQRELHDLAQLELDFAELLTDGQNDEKCHLRKVLQVTANAQVFSSKQRHVLLGNVIQFGNVLYDFIERAVSDCELTVEAVERARLDYRGSLLWLKKCSATLDPGDSLHMEDFRKVQQVVKCRKQRMDQLKEDMALKVDTLHKARNRILDDHLEEYKKALLAFHSENAAEFCASAEQFDGLESYEIDVLKILNDPIGLLALEERRKSNMEAMKPNPPKGTFKLPQSSATAKHRQQRYSAESDADENDLVELEEVELGTEAFEPCMERVHELLRFEDVGVAGTAVESADLLLVSPVEDDDVQWKCPLKTTAASIGLNLLKHHHQQQSSLTAAASAERILLEDDDNEGDWCGSFGCSSADDGLKSPLKRSKQPNDGSLSNSKQQPESNGGGVLLLEEIEDLLFQSCPSSPKIGSNSNLHDNNKLINPKVGTIDNVPKLAPPPNCAINKKG